MRTWSKLSWGIAACSLLVAACTDDAASPSGDPEVDDPPAMEGTPPEGTPPDDMPPVPSVASDAIASEVFASWNGQRPGDAGIVEYAQFRLHGDAIPMDMTQMSWTPHITVSFFVDQVNFAAGTSTRVNLIEPQTATLVSRVDDDVTVQLADGTLVEATLGWFAMLDPTPERAERLASLTHWSDIVCGVADLAYAFAKPASYVIASPPASIYDALDVPVVVTPYGNEKTLMLGDTKLDCVQSDDGVGSGCVFQVASASMVGVGAADVTYHAQASGEELGKLVSALASFGGTLTGDQGSATMTCADGACNFTWTRPRPSL